MRLADRLIVPLPFLLIGQFYSIPILYYSRVSGRSLFWFERSEFRVVCLFVSWLRPHVFTESLDNYNQRTWYKVGASYMKGSFYFPPVPNWRPFLWFFFASSRGILSSEPLGNVSAHLQLFVSQSLVYFYYFFWGDLILHNRTIDKLNAYINKTTRLK